jgi:hypothetical protein
MMAPLTGRSADEAERKTRRDLKLRSMGTVTVF